MVLGTGWLAGCSSTQQTAARLRLNSARLVRADARTEVTHPTHAVHVLHLSLVRSGRGSAVIVKVHNTSPAVSDLPISVGYLRGGTPVYLNAGTGAGYFSSHLPVLGAGQTINWVFSSRRRVPARARLFARIGGRPAVSVGRVRQVPDLSVQARGTTGRTVAVEIHNTTGLPQYQLQVYYVGRHGDRVISAGRRTVSYIGSGSIKTVRIEPAGAQAGAALQIEALPTIFR